MYEKWNDSAIAKGMQKGYPVCFDNRKRKNDKYILKIEHDIQNIIFKLECLFYEMYIAKELGIVFPARRK